MSNKIVNGNDRNFFTKVTVASASFGDYSDVIIGVKFIRSLMLSNEGTGIVEYSFNGNTVHGDLTPGKASESVAFDNRQVNKIWFRLKSGAASVIRVEAWS